MKKTHIIGIIIIALAIGAILTTMNDASTYADFAESVANPGKTYHVVGKLNRDKETTFDPQKNANEFIFFMVDNKGLERKVVLHKSKPQDFEKSEQIVVIGNIEGNDFHAQDILMKCPSKYNDGTPGSGQANNSQP